MKFDAGTVAGWTAVEIAWVVVVVALSWAIAYLIIWGGENMTDREQICFFLGMVVGGIVLFGCGLVVG